MDNVGAARHQGEVQRELFPRHEHDPVQTHLTSVPLKLACDAYRPVDVAPSRIGGRGRQQKWLLMSEAGRVKAAGELLGQEARGEIPRDEARVLHEGRL